MKILHLMSSLNPAHGGPIEGVMQISVACERLGHDIEIASLDRPDVPWVTENPIKVHALGYLGGESYDRLSKPFPWLRYGYSPQFSRWLRKNRDRYDAIVVHGLWNYAALGARRGLAGSKIPYVVYTHGALSPWLKKGHPIKHIAKQLFWLVCEGPLLANARSVIFTTEEERRLARDAFWPYRLKERVLGFGLADPLPGSPQQIEAFYSAFPRLRGRRFILFLGRIHPVKGIDLLIRAFADCAARHPDLDIVIAGPDSVGWAAELKAIATGCGIGDRVVWTGMLTGDAKWGAYRAAEAFVLPSHSESFGFVVVEAMACAKPVLITNGVSIWREVEQAGAGLVGEATTTGIAGTLGKLLAAPASDVEQMGQRSRNLFLKRFEISQAAEALLDLLGPATNERAEPAPR